jgi:hypothetical protein
MSIQNRKTIRGRLKAVIESAMEGTGKPLQETYGYYPKDLGGLSPVCTIESLPIQINLKTAVSVQVYDFAVTFWALTDGPATSGMTAGDAEDKLDDLHYALTLALKDPPAALALGNAEYFQPSEQAQFAYESGNVYQAETHYVRLTTP